MEEIIKGLKIPWVSHYIQRSLAVNLAVNPSIEKVARRVIKQFSGLFNFTADFKKCHLLCPSWRIMTVPWAQSVFYLVHAWLLAYNVGGTGKRTIVG